jgi:hypothetical protein
VISAIMHAPIYHLRRIVMEGKNHIILIVQTDIAPEMEEEFNRWYDKEHIPRLLGVPGVVKAVRGLNAGNGPKYIAIYEHENSEVQHTPAYKNAIETEWAHKIQPHLRNFKRNVFTVL